MSKTTNELQVSAWTLVQAPEEIILTRFMLSEDAYETLAQWCRERTKKARVYKSIVLAGLSEVLAFLVPEIAYMDTKAYSPSAGRRCLALYLLGRHPNDDQIRNRIQAAINVWLGTIYPDKPADTRMAVAASTQVDENWHTLSVDTGLVSHTGACAVPCNPLLYNALVVQTVAQLVGKTLTFASGETPTLIPRTPQSSPYGGVELVAFPPKQEAGGPGLYSEVITIMTATFPERKEAGIHVLARPSMRNWGRVTGYDTNKDPARSLDVFMPPKDDTLGFGGHRHTSFSYKATVDNWDAVKKENQEKQVVPRWKAHRGEKVFELVRRLIGGGALAGADLMKPALGQEGFWVLPRLAPGSGDRFLAGGAGIGWPDRVDIGQSLDAPLRALGFERSPEMRRIIARRPLKGPFHQPVTDESAAGQRRSALMKVLEQIGNGPALDLMILHIQDDTPRLVEKELIKLLGVPAEHDGQTFAWEDGLTVSLTSAAAGPFAQLLPKAQLSDDERTGKTGQQIGQMLERRRQEASVNASERMADHLSGLRKGAKGVGCAIVEMPNSFLGNPEDPYAVGRRTLAEHDVLPQVILVHEEAPTEKYRAAVYDCLRMLGVVPAFEDHLILAPAALAVVSRNSSASVSTQALPIAARVRDGVMECAMPAASGEPDWRPYAKAALSIYRGDYERFSRNQTDQNKLRFQTFVTEALQQIDQRGDTLVLLDGETLGLWLPGIQNTNLTFDQLDTGARVFKPSDLPQSRLVRFQADSSKLPSYYHLDQTQWPAGLFAWGQGRRTAYGLKKKPLSAKTTSRTSSISRHLPPGDNTAADNKPRRLAAMDEMCAFFSQEGDQFTDLQLMVHRLRSVHVQYGDDTRLPFPLHELRLLGSAVTS